jgi:hypothetical protein
MLILRKDQTDHAGQRASNDSESSWQLYLDLQSNVNSSLSLSLARVKDWEEFKSLWVPEDFRIEGCRVLAGMRSGDRCLKALSTSQVGQGLPSPLPQ